MLPFETCSAAPLSPHTTFTLSLTARSPPLIRAFLPPYPHRQLDLLREARLRVDAVDTTVEKIGKITTRLRQKTDQTAKNSPRQPPHRQRHLRDKYRRHAVLELFVLGLVMPDLHPQPRPDASADGRQSQQHTLRDAPTLVLRLPLVDAVHDEGDHRDGRQINQNQMLRFHNGQNSVGSQLWRPALLALDCASRFSSLILRETSHR